MSQWSTLVELIEARKNEDQRGITFILGDTEEIFVSYKELFQTSLRLLYHFQQAGYQPGDEVIFQIDDNQRFIYAFWACVLGGMIPVPVTTGTNDEHKLKLFKIWDILNNPWILVTEEFLGKMEGYAIKNGLGEKMNAIKARATLIDANIPSENCGEIFCCKPTDLAFIQFSSGSTGDPKGVMITHSNVLIDLDAVIRWDSINENDVGLNWMPLTHDMGLIGTHIKGVLANIQQYNINTNLFIRHPSLWIQKASEHKATLLYSPNFGYKHFLKFYNPEKSIGWDLSSVRLIYNGAEPISLDLCNEFLDKMSIYGLQRKAMRPVYGLAEGTIAVAFPKYGEDFTFHALDRNHLKLGETVVDVPKEDKNAIIFMDEGYPIYNCYIRICDEEGRDIGENKIGYVQISGGNVTSGYYNNAEATRKAISADGWLNTMDLGFMRDGRIIITGRAKDVIFVAGQNYYSHDIERIGEDVEGIELGKIAAVGVFNDRLGCDELILFVMYRQKVESFMPMAANLKKAISQRLGIEVSQVIPVKNIPKTTSGKTQRYKLRESYVNGEFDLVKQKMQELFTEEFKNRVIDAPINATQERLVKIWSELLHNDNIGIRDNFFSLGGDSLRITQILSRIRESFAVELDQSVIFEHQDIESLAKVIDSATQMQKQAADHILPVADESDKSLLSFSQQRLWFLDRLNLNSSQYNLATGLVLKGRLDRDVLEKSLNTIMNRHEVLQAYFVEEDGRPVQKFDPSAEIALKYSDLRDIPEKDRRMKAEEMAKAEAADSFTLEKAPLIRGRLIRMDDQEHILILAAHHIVFDGWSFGILLKELNFFYEAYLNQKDASLPELPIQYVDYSKWQKNRIEAGHLSGQLAYWKKKLEGSATVLELPIDKQRPPVQKYDGAKFTAYIPKELMEEIQAYAAKEKSTPFMVLLAAFKVLLYRYSGQSDILVGSPIANRNRKDIEELIGFFTNNLVLRTFVSDEIKFNVLLKNVKETTLEAYANQDVPFEKLVEELHIPRDMSRNPLFQVLFGMQNTPLPGMEFTELNISTLPIDAGFARFDLAVDLRNDGEGLAADFEYNTDLFNQDTIVRMAGHYRQLLINIMKNPCLAVEQYEILTPEEKETLLYRWNATQEDIEGISNWTELFEAQAAATPEAIAVSCGAQQLTYAELDRRSNQLAQYLYHAGVRPESVVGVYIDRSVDMLVALLGIHKAGAAYLPMDPIFPKDRLEYMMEDSQVGIILSQQALSDTLPKNNARVICLDTEWDKIAVHSVERVASVKEPHHLAYIIYTSGSTGKPKGVQIEQKALVNFLLSMAKNTELSDKESLLAVTTLSFDIAALELYMPLIRGARVVIAQRDEVMDGNCLIRLLNEEKITMMQATPATWRLLIESGWSGSTSLKVLCGGEALPRDLANKLLDLCAVLFNVYGPTETTVWSTMDRIRSKDEVISIGKPIANTQVYVVDKAMNPVPVGIPGELLIGGDGLARGYLNLPELTDEKFIPNPFSDIPGARVYKTGDMVKYMPDSRLECIGRKDNQVKIRGFRIELGEIETLIGMEPSVKTCVVVAKELIQGEAALVAYIIPSAEYAGKELPVESIRKSLKEKLPDYMVPSAFVPMEAFPMTPNGKIDRKALPLPERYRPQREENYTAPSNEVEKELVAIWQEVLKLDRIGINESFFDLGGHSLLLAQVRSKIEGRLHKEISMMDLFKYPTISSLCSFLTGDSNPDAVFENNRKQVDKTQSDKIAVIGLSGRFPGARNTKELWNNLCEGIESISRFTDEEILEEGVSPEMLNKPGYVKAWGALDDIDKFDAQFFGYNPREAEILDPQQRVFLEESWKALENAGYDAGKFNGLVGVYASVGMNTYAQRLSESHGNNGLASDYQIMTSNDKDFLATRVAYKLNLEGPGVTVQTACSSSLVAIHLACQSLMNGDCDMALAGGVSIRMPQKTGYLYQEGMILSPDGHCKAFDEQAKGTVGGNGAGVVVLKRLSDAIADGDNISAVILGTAINNDGALKVGYTAPRIDGQAKCIAEAHDKAGINPETITYIEAHGTGTPLGDPIEIEALTKAFNRKTNKKGFCAVGSLKTNIGHLDAAAGVSGFIKAVLSLRNKTIVPNSNFKSPNPKINFSDSPFFVSQSLRSWQSESSPLRAGISSFGIGGTNAHAVLEEGPVIHSDAWEGKPLLFVLSAKSKKALEKMTANLAAYLEENKGINPADAAFTLQVGRKEFEYRRCFICTSVEEALELLKDADQKPQQVWNGALEQSQASQQLMIHNPEEYPLEQLAQLWVTGAVIEWSKLYKNQKRKRIELPVYPFEGQSFWVKKATAPEKEKSPAKPERRADVSEWFYTPVWKQYIDDGSEAAEPGEAQKDSILVLRSQNSLSDSLVSRLKEERTELITAIVGKEFGSVDDGTYTFDIDNAKHYDQLLGTLSKAGKVPGVIVNLLGITEDKAEDMGERLFFSMLYLAQAVGTQSINKPIQIKVFTNNAQRLFHEQELQPEKTLHLGACRVIPREYPNIKCCSIDCVLPEAGSAEEEELVALLMNEILHMPCDGLVAYRGPERWIQSFDEIKLNAKSNRSIQLKNDGVYLITGGLGGLGLETAEYITREVKAKLVLVGRSGFPEMEQWDSWINTHGKNDATSNKIRRLRKILASGTDILISREDVCEKDQMLSLRSKIIDKYGKLDGIIHAAGTPGGGMIQLKKKEDALKVLKPKVQGTRVLYDVFKDASLEFILFYSSLNAITGGFGQIDYSAANIFLDAFAQAHDRYKGTRVISINWDRWSGVGMASNGIQGLDGDTAEVHPLIGRKVMDNEEKVIYSGEMSPEKDWVLSEHLVLGIPTIAGTTYLEMARAAVEDLTGNLQPEISDVLFMNPLAVKPGEKRSVYTILQKNGDAYDFRIVSSNKTADIENANFLEHIRGKIKAAEKTESKSFNLAELKERCGAQTVFSVDAQQQLSETFISFGGRWRSLKKFILGDNEGLAEAELNQDFAPDFEDYKIHPALLDIATGAVRLAAGGNYLPFAYEKLEVYRPLPAKIYGHIRFKNGYTATQEIITSDIDILDETGEQLIEIKNFSMKLVSAASAENIKTRTSSGSQKAEYATILKLVEEAYSEKGGMLIDGITAKEGIEALHRILNGGFRTQVAVSAKDIKAAIESANYFDQPNMKGSLGEAAVVKERHPRPELENDFVPPKSEAEKKLAEIWQDVLGIDRVGIHDEFFALGGDSLLLIQFHTKLKEAFTTDIAVVDLYKYNTIALLAKHLSNEGTEEEQPAFEEINSRVNKQKELMMKRRQMMNRGKGVK